MTISIAGIARLTGALNSSGSWPANGSRGRVEALISVVGTATVELQGATPPRPLAFKPMITAGYAPHLPFAVFVGIGSVGWISAVPDLRGL
jgi:hypothetical protein